MPFKKFVSSFKKKVESIKARSPKEAPIADIAPPAPRERESQLVDLKAITIVKVVLIVLAFLSIARIVEELGSVFVILTFSVIIASAIGPIVDRWSVRLGRIGAALVVYLIILAVLTIIISSFIPVVGKQIIDIASSISSMINTIATDGIQNIPVFGKFAPTFDTFLREVDREQLITQLQAHLQNIGASLLSVAGNIWSLFGSVFGGVFYAITVLILSFYMVIQQHSFEEFLASLIPSRYEPYIIAKSKIVRRKMGAWLRGQLTVCSVIAAIAFVGLMILGVPYALTLAVFAGLMAIIPYLGPAIGAVPSILIALSVSPWTALFVVILYFVVIQFLESNLITPVIMGRVVGLNPVTIITVLLIGGSLFGIMGIILAIPVTTAISVFLKDYQQREK